VRAYYRRKERRDVETSPLDAAREAIADNPAIASSSTSQLSLGERERERERERKKKRTVINSFLNIHTPLLKTFSSLSMRRLAQPGCMSTE